MNYAVRLTLSYADCSGIVSQWADRSSQVSVFEHPADDKVNRSHCHIGIWNVECKSEALKRMIPNRGKGNEFWSWKEMKDSPDQGTFLTYCSKGIHAPKFLKNISPDIVERFSKQYRKPMPQGPMAERPSVPKSEFEKLLNHCAQKYEEQDIPDVNTIKHDICFVYLNKRQAVPRTGDLNRYAYSIHMILKTDKFKGSFKDTALMRMISDYVILLDS